MSSSSQGLDARTGERSSSPGEKTECRADAFTSINLNYLAKARVLGHSLKKHHPEIRLHVMLSDAIPDWFDLSNEPFDSVITIADLGIEEWKSWAFQHSVVELCTAVKPFAFRYLLDRTDSERLYYFDPDVVFFSRCDGLFDELDESSIILTPHVTEPDSDLNAVIDNEISSMAHGIYNLGFLGIRNDAEGRRLAEWWCERLRHFCHDDIPRGLFTDQRWMDFVPAFFDRCRIVRDPAYNVATWNYSMRELSGSLESGVLVEGKSLGFHHFSGVDNGASHMMLEKYAKDMPAAWELDDWYRRECEAQGQETVARIPWHFATYENGDPIHPKERILYRRHEDLQEAFRDPFAVVRENGRIACYHDWLREPAHEEALHLLEMDHPPFVEFAHRTLRAMRVYVRNTPRMAGWQKRVVLAGLRTLSAVGRGASRVLGLN